MEPHRASPLDVPPAKHALNADIKAKLFMNIVMIMNKCDMMWTGHTSVTAAQMTILMSITHTHLAGHSVELKRGQLRDWAGQSM